MTSCSGDGHHSALERLPPHLQHVACALGQLIQEQDAVVRQRHLAGHRQLTRSK
jgi:hypothetical protein